MGSPDSQITEAALTPQPSLTPKATRTPQVPIDPIDTVTPFPEKISSPTLTASATSTLEKLLSPLVLPNSFSDFEIVTRHNFEYLNENIPGQVRYRTQNGMVEIEGSSFWPDFRRQYPATFQPGEGVILRYKLAGAAEARAFFTTTTLDGVNLRWGVILNDRPYTEVLQADQKIGENILRGNLELLPDHWYYLSLRIDQPSSFSALIWDPDAPEQQLAFIQDMPTEWGTPMWDFVLRGKSGKLYLTDYAEFRVPGTP